MDTELYIVGKDVAELKIPKKFRFEKISSDFKMSILLYGKIQEYQQLKARLPFEILYDTSLFDFHLTCENFVFRSTSGQRSRIVIQYDSYFGILMISELVKSSSIYFQDSN